MTIYPVFIDCRPAYLRVPGGSVSLLQMPVGTTTVLGLLHQFVSLVAKGDATVAAAFETDNTYATSIRDAADAGNVSIARHFGALLERCEPSDWLMLVDAAHVPNRAFDAAGLRDAVSDARCVTHFVALNNDSASAQERVSLDKGGCVRRIERYYAGFTAVDAHAISCSLVSGAAAREISDEPIESLTEVREKLAGRRIPSRDVVLDDGAVDLTHERGLLHLSERFVLELTARAAPQANRDPTTSLHIGAGCRIHPSARLLGPVVIQDDVTVEAHVSIIGPTLLGAGCRARKNSTVAQCVVAPGTTVPPNTTVHRRVLLSCPGPDRPLKRHKARDQGPAGGGLPRLAADGIGSAGQAQPVYPTVKCVLEALVAGVALLVLSPLFAVVAILIKLDSRGAVLFGDMREGKGGRVFRCWKFRTMIEDAHALQRALYKDSHVDGPQFKLRNDPRITRVGARLRATNIDEVPQLINVALGQMSLIGPRPSPFRENQICVAWRQARLAVRPGITGLWQICRRERTAGDFHQWIYYDMLYVRHLSFWLDVKILLATLWTLGGRWSVPLSWMVPARELYDDEGSFVPTHIPILGDGHLQPAAASGHSARQDSACLST